MTHALPTATPPPLAPISAGVSPRPGPLEPRGLPRWLWLLGVGVQPLVTPDRHETRTWMVCAGAGVISVAALFDDSTDQNRVDTTREDHR
jgi:hypothetical protein